MPLDEEEEGLPRRILPLHRLDDAVSRARGDSQARAELVGRLVVAGIHRTAGDPHRLAEKAVALDFERVEALAAAPALVPLIPGIFKIGDQGASEMDVGDLQSPADPENRHVRLQRVVEDPALEVVALPVDILELRMVPPPSKNRRVAAPPPGQHDAAALTGRAGIVPEVGKRSEEHTSELQS